MNKVDDDRYWRGFSRGYNAVATRNVTKSNELPSSPNTTVAFLAVFYNGRKQR
jgi:hypothetical protein